MQRSPLSPETLRRVDILFREADRERAAQLLVDECGNKLPFCEELNSQGLERIRFAALKVGGGDLAKLRQAVEMAKIDWRDLLMAAGFGYDARAHERWVPEAG